MVPATPSPGVSTTFSGTGKDGAARSRRRDDRLRDRVFRRLIERRGKVQDLVLGHVAMGVDGHDLRPPVGQRAGLVEDQRL